MKVYIYNDEAIDRAFGGVGAKAVGCPSGLQQVGDPGQADVFFVPRELGDLERRHPRRVRGVLPCLKRLPHWKGNEARHFLYMHSDEDRPIGTKAVVFRCSVNRNDKDPRTVTMPPPVEDFGHLVGVDYEQLLYHVSFVGYDEDPKDIRKKAIGALQTCSRLNCYLDPIGRHYGSYEGTELGERRRQSFVNSLKQSRLVLAPRGAGQHSYRFFEAMSAGRIPVLIADEAELPFEDLIDYDSCVFHVEEAEADKVDEVILRINERCRPQPCMQEMARRGREYWLKYLAPARWDEMMVRYLEKLCG